MNIKELPDYYLHLDETYSLASKAHDFMVNHSEWKYVPYIWVVANSPNKFKT